MNSNDYFYSVLSKYNKGIFIYVDFVHDYYTDTIKNLVSYWSNIWRLDYCLKVDKENQRYIIKFDLHTSSSSDPCCRDFIFLGNTRYGLSYLLLNGVNNKNTYIDCLDTSFIIVPITEDIKEPKPICKKCGSHKLININGKCNDLFTLIDYSTEREYNGYVPESLEYTGDYIDLTICTDCNTVQKDLNYEKIMKECFN
jgi:hypothetical protein